MQNRRKILLCIVLISAAGAALYGRTVNYPFQFDDNIGIVQNPAIRNISDFRAVWNVYSPRFLTYLSFALNYHFGVLNPAGYRVVNIIIHISASIALFFIIFYTLEAGFFKNKPGASARIWPALAAALIFTSHPVQTQAVTYIYQRFASMAALGCLLSLVFYIKHSFSRRRFSGWYAASLAAFLAAVFIKENSVILPASIVLYDVIFLKSPGKKLAKKMLPYAAILFLGLWVVFFSGTVPEIRNIEASFGGRESPFPPWHHYFFTQIRVIASYLRIVVFPVNQNLDYDYPLYRSLLRAPVALSLLLHGVILAGAAAILKKHRMISFGVFFFYLTLMPESSIFPVGALELELIFEHRLYLPMAGASAAAAGLMMLPGRRRKIAAALLLCSAAAAFSFLTFERNHIWRSEYSLLKDTVSKSPNKTRPLINLGTALVETKETEKARYYLRRALKIDPDNPAALTNIGLSYFNEDDYESALEYYTKAVESAPGSAFALYNIGNVYERLRDFEKAVIFYSKAVDADPGNARAFNNRGVMYANLGLDEKAEEDFSRALEIDPHYGPAYANRAGVFIRRGDRDRALLDMNRARGLGIVFE